MPGLYYYRARYYDPQSGRFVQEDPSGQSGGFTLYTYTENRPTGLLDPLGLDPWYQESVFDWRIKNRVPVPKDPDTYVMTMCIRKCVGEPFTLSSTHEKALGAGHTANTPLRSR